MAFERIRRAAGGRITAERERETDRDEVSAIVRRVTMFGELEWRPVAGARRGAALYVRRTFARDEKEEDGREVDLRTLDRLKLRECPDRDRLRACDRAEIRGLRALVENDGARWTDRADRRATVDRLLRE